MDRQKEISQIKKDMEAAIKDMPKLKPVMKKSLRFRLWLRRNTPALIFFTAIGFAAIFAGIVAGIGYIYVSY
jgi:hypothetical protein